MYATVTARLEWWHAFACEVRRLVVLQTRNAWCSDRSVCLERSTSRPIFSKIVLFPSRAQKLSCFGFESNVSVHIFSQILRVSDNFCATAACAIQASAGSS